MNRTPPWLLRAASCVLLLTSSCASDPGASTPADDASLDGSEVADDVADAPATDRDDASEISDARDASEVFDGRDGTTDGPAVTDAPDVADAPDVVDAAMDRPDAMTTVDAPDAADVLDVLDVVDAAIDRPDVVDAMTAMDVLDASVDRPDVRDAMTAMDVVDASVDRPDAIDVVDAGDAADGSDAADVVDAAVCAAPRTVCGGACVDTASDAEHCGRCGSPCASGNACSAGVCVPVAQVSAGEAFTCARLGDGTVQCWGSNEFGQSGWPVFDRNAPRVRPTPIEGVTGAVEVVAGRAHACARLSNGTVRCWGANGSAQLGLGTNTAGEFRASPVEGITTARALAAGFSHTCALLADGTVRCWGTGGSGQLGDGTGRSASRPVTVSSVTTAVSIAAANFATCAALADGTVVCWGSNSTGQLGAGTTGGTSLVAVPVMGVTRATSLTAGTLSFCALRSDATVACWGYNGGGILGDGTFTQRNTAVVATAYAGVRALTLGVSHACAVRADGTVACTGINRYGELGNGLTAASGASPLTPVLGLANLASGAAATLLDAGDNHTCAITVGGTVCWGRGETGQLGNGGAIGVFEAQTVAGVRGAVQLVARDHRTCARFADGTASCWGSNTTGESGVAPGGDGTFSPRAVQGLTGAAELALGAFHSCARMGDGTARCWGYNRDGQLGDGTTTSRATTTTPVSTLRTIAQLATSQTTTCARTTASAVQCWGSNAGGMLGLGYTDLFSHEVPARAITGVSDASAVFMSLFNGCMVRAGGAVWCWGENQQGQLGNGTTTTSFTPVATMGLTNVVQGSGGYHHFCARKDDGTVWCWGLNQSGQCGQALATANVLRPTRVPGLAGVAEVAAGENHTCARLSDGSVWCWGENIGAQLGTGTLFVSQPIPTRVPGVSGAVEITAGTRHTCARLGDGSARCWGEFTAGALGSGHLFRVRY